MREERGGGPLAVAAAISAIAVATILPARAEAHSQDRPTAAMDAQWHFNIAPYFWMPGVQGEVGVANLPPVSVDASFSDIFENFDVGLLGRFEGETTGGAAYDTAFQDLDWVDALAGFKFRVPLGSKLSLLGRTGPAARRAGQKPVTQTEAIELTTKIEAIDKTAPAHPQGPGR